MTKKLRGVIAVATMKGGGGKTTISVHLAVAAEAAGHGPVAMLDFDPQGTTATWWNLREHASTPAYFPVEIENLADAVVQLQAQGIKLIIIDTPPAIGNTLDSVFDVADLVVIPVRPSPLDIWALNSTLAKAQGKSLFVLNAAKANSSVASQTAAALSEHGVVSRIIVGNRLKFASAMTDGHTLQELDRRDPGAKEIADLWKDVSRHLERVQKAAING